LAVGEAPRLILGWREWVAFPELDIARIKAKVDTGARPSALHTHLIEPFRQGGQRWVRFGIHPLQRSHAESRICVAEVVDQRVVSDSGGHKEKRWVIETPLLLGGESWPIEITLTKRNNMLFRLLLGRTAIRGRAMVDPGRSYLTGRKPKPIPATVKALSNGPS